MNVLPCGGLGPPELVAVGLGEAAGLGVDCAGMCWLPWLLD